MKNSNALKKLLSLAFVAFLVMSILPVTSFAAQANKVLLSYNAQWSYSDIGKDLGTIWLRDDYDYSEWKKGKAPFGFGDAVSETNPNIPLATEVGFGPNEKNKYMTTYAKTEIDVGSLAGYKVLQIYVHVDDGAVVYFNGQEAFRKGIGKDVIVNYNTPAKFSAKEETFIMPISALKDGKNIISAEVHQDDGYSSDLWFELSITALVEEPVPIDYRKTTIPNPDVKVGEVSRVVLSFKGDTKTSKGFTWYTSQASANSDLQVIEKTNEKKPSFDGALKFKGTVQKSTNAPEFLVHKAEATRLKPDTEYQFRVGDATLDLWSKVGTFVTAGDDAKFTFFNVADSQAKTEEEAILSANTFKSAYKTVSNSDFMVLNGDIVDTGSKEEQWGWVLNHSDDVMLNTTFVACAGNHEDDPESYIEHFNINVPEGSDTKTGAYYSYNYENVHFIVLNTNEDSEEYRNFTPAQIEWLKTDAKTARANSDIDWIIVTMHKGPYTTSNHGTDKDIMDINGVRIHIPPIFSELGVDLVLQGHDHIYARTKPIKERKAVSVKKEIQIFEGEKVEYSVNPDGTIYMIPSTAGPKVYYKNKKLDSSYYNLFEVANEHSAAKYGSDPNDPKRPVRSQIQNFVEINIDGKKLSAIAYEIDQNINNAKPYVIDTFGILKTNVKQLSRNSVDVMDQLKYTVKPGDNLWRIGIKFGTTYQEIQKLNEITDPSLIFPGQIFIIPTKK